MAAHQDSVVVMVMQTTSSLRPAAVPCNHTASPCLTPVRRSLFPHQTTKLPPANTSADDSLAPVPPPIRRPALSEREVEVLVDRQRLRREHEHREGREGVADRAQGRVRQRTGQVDVADLAGEARGQRGQGDRHGGLLGAGARAARADSAETNAKDLATEVAQRRGSVEGVNLDEELANLTLYQQAYNASARLISAAQDMMDALMAIR